MNAYICQNSKPFTSNRYILFYLNYASTRLIFKRKDLTLGSHLDFTDFHPPLLNVDNTRFLPSKGITWQAVPSVYQSSLKSSK